MILTIPILKIGQPLEGDIIIGEKTFEKILDQFYHSKRPCSCKYKDKEYKIIDLEIKNGFLHCKVDIPEISDMAILQKVISSVDFNIFLEKVAIE